ncbi:MAG: hypothetical protein LIO79_11140 [Rikenellaceae bacterium]|nr:hypothetical protein [Rikenellaceae bacterium]
MKILVNCSDSLFCRLIVERFEIEGNKITTVNGDNEMFSMLGCEDYDLVILVMDYRFADNGMLLKLTADGIRFFILSQLADEYSVYSAYASGVVSYMSLPIDFSKFILRIRELSC